MPSHFRTRNARAPRHFAARTLLLLAFISALSPFAHAQMGVTTDRKKAAAEPPSTITRRIEKDGVAIEFSLTTPPGSTGGLVAGADAVATFRMTDTPSARPLTGIRPNAWLSALKPGEPTPDEAQCRERLRTLTSGSLSANTAIDLNTFFLLTLNHDNTVAFINPQVSFARTKLESLVMLPGRGADWALTPDGSLLLVSVPERGTVAVINTTTRKLETTIDVGTGTRPRRVALHPGAGGRLWVELEGSMKVAVIDVKERKLLRTVDVGEGEHHFAFASGRFAYVTNGSRYGISIFDAASLSKIQSIAGGRAFGPIAYSKASRRVYAAVAGDGGKIDVIDPSVQSVVASIPVTPGVVALRFDPSGRYAFAVNQKESTVTVIDATTDKVVATARVVPSPDQVVFTPEFAYVRGTASEKFSLIRLKEVAAGKLTPVEVLAGRRPPSDSPEDLGVADMIAATPEGNSVILANAPDALVYYYVEGMMAPMGTLSNYKRRPLAVSVLDRGLREIAPGIYSAPVKLAGAGRHLVMLLLGAPRVANCFEVEIAEPPGGMTAATPPAASVKVEPEFKGLRAAPNRAVSLRFSLKDAATGAPLTGLDDVRVLVFEPPGVWQQRQWAKGVGGGVYEVMQTFPRAGRFLVMFSVASRGVAFRDLPFTEVNVAEGSQE